MDGVFHPSRIGTHPVSRPVTGKGSSVRCDLPGKRHRRQLVVTTTPVEGLTEVSGLTVVFQTTTKKGIRDPSLYSKDRPKEGQGRGHTYRREETIHPSQGVNLYNTSIMDLEEVLSFTVPSRTLVSNDLVYTFTG